MNRAELFTATSYISGKLDSLDNDLARAYFNIPNIQSAPFPIAMYILSVVDHFSALIAGWSETNRRLRRFQTQRMIRFCRRYLNYPSRESTLLVAIYRHSLMHTSQPQMITDQNGIGYGWSLANVDPNHMQILPYPSLNGQTVQVLQVGLKNLVDNLRSAMLGQGGYRSRLQVNSRLQANFTSCMNEIGSKTVNL